jgi:hypothetical protein
VSRRSPPASAHSRQLGVSRTRPAAAFASATDAGIATQRSLAIDVPWRPERFARCFSSLRPNKRAARRRRNCFLDGDNLRREGQLEGIAKAKAAGIYKGRPASIDAVQVRAIKAQGLGASEIAKALKIGRASVYRILETG